jgi:hypothetical protein
VPERLIVAAKYAGLAAWLFVLFVPAPLAAPLLKVAGSAAGQVDVLGLVSGGIVFGLVALFVAAFGLLASVVARRQLMAAALAFTVGAGVLLAGRFHESLFGGPQGAWEPALGAHHPLFAVVEGRLDSRWLVLPLCGTAWLLFAALRALEWSRARQWGRRLDHLLSVGLAGALAALLGVLAARHPVQWDLHAWQRLRLSPPTLAVLGRLSGPLHLIAVCPSRAAGSREAARLLNRFREASPNVAVEYVDPERDLVRTKELALRYQLARGDGIIVDGGSRFDFVELPREGFEPGARPGETPLAGEERVAEAVRRVVDPDPPVVGFVRGHGERDVDDAVGAGGAGRLARRVARANMQVRSAPLAELLASNRCDALVVAGPTVSFSPAEADVMGEYVAQGGRALFLLDAGTESGLERVLHEWGVAVGSDRVVEPRPGGKSLLGLRRVGDLPGTGEIQVLAGGEHPITRGLEGLMLTFYAPRSVVPLAGGASEDRGAARRWDKPLASVLAAGSAAGWAESELEQDPPQFDAGYDRPGPVAVAVAVERGVPPGLDVQLHPVRLVVSGDSDFAANDSLTGANAEFLVRCLGWLTDRAALLEAPVAVRSGMTFRGGAARLTLGFAVLVLAVPCVALALGGLVALGRRDRRTLPEPESAA